MAEGSWDPESLHDQGSCVAGVGECSEGDGYGDECQDGGGEGGGAVEFIKGETGGGKEKNCS